MLASLAVVLVGYLARALYGNEAAARSMVLFSLFPGSVALSWAYSEAALVVCAAATFLALHRQRWLVAGIFAALGTATRPNGIGLVLACAVAAGIAIWRERQWRALIAPALAPLGVLGFHLFLTRWTGESGAWMLSLIHI